MCIVEAGAVKVLLALTKLLLGFMAGKQRATVVVERVSFMSLCLWSIRMYQCMMKVLSIWAQMFRPNSMFVWHGKITREGSFSPVQRLPHLLSVAEAGVLPHNKFEHGLHLDTLGPWITYWPWATEGLKWLSVVIFGQKFDVSCKNPNSM